MMKTHAYLSRFVPGLFSGVLCFGFLVPGAFAASPGDPSGAPGMAMKAPAVAAGKGFAVDVLPGRRYSARILSPAVVSITSRVSGEIVEAPFAEGGRVKKGDVLFRLDPVRYEAAVKSAEGARKEAEAELEYAKRSLDRVKKLWEQNAESRDAYDAAVRTAKTAEAALLAAEANVALAEDDLKHTVISAPSDGRAGVAAFPVGSWVSSSSGALTTVVVTDPVRVRFAVSMKDVASVFGSVETLREEGSAEIERADGAKLETPVRIAFTDNSAGADTDTLDVYAEVANPDEALIPGSTVAVELHRRSQGGAIGVLPSSVMHDEKGAWVWVISAENRAEKRRIEVESTTESAAIIASGLRAGETVITDGTHKPREGEPVRIVKGE